MDAIAEIHPLRIIPGDISPAHILVNPETDQFRPIDFGVTLDLPKRHVASRRSAAREEMPAYLPSKQTGRMNPAVDP